MTEPLLFTRHPRSRSSPCVFLRSELLIFSTPSAERTCSPPPPSYPLPPPEKLPPVNRFVIRRHLYNNLKPWHGVYMVEVPRDGRTGGRRRQSWAYVQPGSAAALRERTRMRKGRISRKRAEYKCLKWRPLRCGRNGSSS